MAEVAQARAPLQSRSILVVSQGEIQLLQGTTYFADAGKAISRSGQPGWRRRGGNDPGEAQHRDRFELARLDDLRDRVAPGELGLDGVEAEFGSRGGAVTVEGGRAWTFHLDGLPDSFSLRR